MEVNGGGSWWIVDDGGGWGRGWGWMVAMAVVMESSLGLTYSLCYPYTQALIQITVQVVDSPS